ISATVTLEEGSPSTCVKLEVTPSGGAAQSQTAPVNGKKQLVFAVLESGELTGEVELRATGLFGTAGGCDGALAPNEEASKTGTLKKNARETVELPLRIPDGEDVDGDHWRRGPLGADCEDRPDAGGAFAN